MSTEAATGDGTDEDTGLEAATDVDDITDQGPRGRIDAYISTLPDE